MTYQSDYPVLAVGCFVFNDAAELLLIRRGKNPGRGLWTIPGGRVELGEALVDACRREVKEETGIDVEIAELVTIFEPASDDFHYVIIDYLGVPTGSSNRQPVAGGDAIDARWVGLEQLDELPLTTDLLPMARQAFAQANENSSG